MKSTAYSTLLTYFRDFRQGQLSTEALQNALTDVSHSLPANSTPKKLVDHTNTRIDAIVLGVCEAERDAHIQELLRETEAKLIAIEP